MSRTPCALQIQHLEAPLMRTPAYASHSPLIQQKAETRSICFDDHHQTEQCLTYQEGRTLQCDRQDEHSSFACSALRHGRHIACAVLVNESNPQG